LDTNTNKHCINTNVNINTYGHAHVRRTYIYELKTFTARTDPEKVGPPLRLE